MREEMVPVEEVYRSDVSNAASLYVGALFVWTTIKNDEKIPDAAKELIRQSLLDRKKDLVKKMTHNPHWFSENLILLLGKLENLQ